MIFLEYHILDSNTLMPKASYEKFFTNISEYTKFYNLAKSDPYCMINVMKYNPKENQFLKNINDIKLLSVVRENAV